MRQLWSKDKIIFELRRCYEGKIKYPRNLIAIAPHYFGTLHNAYEAAGVPYKKFYKEFNEDKLRDNILKFLASSDVDIGITNYNKRLYDICCKKFGSWCKAIEWASGDISLLPKKRETHTKESLIAKLRELDSKGKKLIGHNFPGLAHWAYKYFGTWEAAINAAGLNYDSYLERMRDWTPELVIKLIKEYANLGKSLTATEAARWNSYLPAKCVEYFGTWKNALYVAGLMHPSDIPKSEPYTEQQAIEILLRYHSKGIVLFYKNIEKENKELANWCVKHFNSWAKAIEACGLDYRKDIFTNAVIPNKKWTKESVIEEILKLKHNNKPLNNKYIKQNYGGLERGARQVFGSWKEAIEASGLDIAHTNRYSSIDSHYGNRWELICKEVLDAIDRHEYHAVYDNCIPDFSKSEHGEWIDAKLSSWTGFSDYDRLIKYLKKCSKLILLYLRGEKCDYKNKNIKLRHISYYYSALRKAGRTDLINKIKLFNKEVETNSEQIQLTLLDFIS